MRLLSVFVYRPAEGAGALGLLVYRPAEGAGAFGWAVNDNLVPIPTGASALRLISRLALPHEKRWLAERTTTLSRQHDTPAAGNHGLSRREARFFA